MTPVRSSATIDGGRETGPVYDDLSTFRVSVAARVAWVTIDHPPLQLVDGALFADLVRLLDAAEADDDVGVLVFESADPDFFLMHGDVHGILRMRQEATVLDGPGAAPATLDRLRTIPKVTIGMIDGQARGGGAEFLSSLDLRFAGPRTVLGQPEVAMGILPGASGTQRLPRLLGRARALEVVLGCGDVTAEEAERWGWVNRLLPSDRLRPFVEELAGRIAAWPPQAVAEAKAAVDAALGPVAPGLTHESNAFFRLIATGGHVEPMERFLAAGGQTREGELTDMGSIIDAMRG
jgi:enoyl-CoA hydratase/carnithine racemase